MGVKYLDFDQFLYPIDHPDVLIPIRRLADLNLVTRPHESTFRHVHKRLTGGLFVLQVPQDDAGRLDQELSCLVVARDLVSFYAHDLGLVAREQAPRRPEPDISRIRGAHHGACLGKTVSLPDLPAGVLGENFCGRLLAQGCSTGEDGPHARKVEFLEELRALDHGDDDGWHHV